MDDGQQNSTVAALDIGTDTISVAVGQITAPGQFVLLGFGKVGANGIHAGCVQDVETAVASIRNAVQEAEGMARQKFTRVTVALTGKHLHSVNKVGRTVLPGNEVTDHDVLTAVRLAMAFDRKSEGSGEDDYVVTHVVKGFTLDNDDTMIDDPVGMTGNVLKAHVHLAIGSDTVVQNLGKCIRRAGLDMEQVMLQPWASAMSCLTVTEKELGVILLDFGAGTVDVACYLNGNIEYTHVVSMGSNNIARDIASILGCSLDDAVEIMRSYGHYGIRPGDQYERVSYVYEATGENRIANVSQVVKIIEARTKEMVENVISTGLKTDGWQYKAGAGIVATGGMTRMSGFADFISSIFENNVRIGAPAMQAGSAVTLCNPEDSTVVGLLMESVRRRSRMGEHKLSTGRLGAIASFWKRLWFGDFSG